MLFEPTTLAATGTALAAALESYGCDPRAVFRSAGLDIDDLRSPGARFRLSSVNRLWREARDATADPCIGITAARYLRPQALHALGLSWMASKSLIDGFSRMTRYSRIANTNLRVEVVETAEQVIVAPCIDDKGLERASEAIDATLAFIVTLCRHIVDRHFAPLKVEFEHQANSRVDQYLDFFAAPVYFGKSQDVLHFDAEASRAPVPAGNEELALEVDRIAERYLATLEPGRVQDKVREILLTMLPSGDIDQASVAKAMNRSVSTLQRQLRAEGLSYRQLLDDTRLSMAVRLVNGGEYSLGQIAYLLGFSDQANFSRAFRRWTGVAPKEYR